MLKLMTFSGVASCAYAKVVQRMTRREMIGLVMAAQATCGRSIGPQSCCPLATRADTMAFTLLAGGHGDRRRTGSTPCQRGLYVRPGNRHVRDGGRSRWRRKGPRNRRGRPLDLPRRAPDLADE